MFLQTSSFCLLQMLMMDWSGVDYCDVFIRCLDSHSDGHPFTAEHLLMSKWWNATSLQIWWRNKLILIMDGLKESIHFHFWLNYSFNSIFFKRHLLETRPRYRLGWSVFGVNHQTYTNRQNETLSHISEESKPVFH